MKMVIYIGLSVLVLVSFASIRFIDAKPLYEPERVDNAMKSIKSEHELVSEFGNPHLIVKSDDGLNIQYIYYENDVDKIKDGFVGFTVYFDDNELVIDWEPIYLRDLLKLIDEETAPSTATTPTAN